MLEVIPNVMEMSRVGGPTVEKMLKSNYYLLLRQMEREKCLTTIDGS